MTVKDKEKHCIRPSYGRKYDLPDSNIISNREICIAGVRGIKEYTRDLVRLDCGHLLLTVNGKQLNMTALSGEEVIIRGELLRIEFS